MDLTLRRSAVAVSQFAVPCPGRQLRHFGRYRRCQLAAFPEQELASDPLERSSGSLDQPYADLSKIFKHILQHRATIHSLRPPLIFSPATSGSRPTECAVPRGHHPQGLRRCAVRTASRSPRAAKSRAQHRPAAAIAHDRSAIVPVSRIGEAALPRHRGHPIRSVPRSRQQHKDRTSFGEVRVLRGSQPQGRATRGPP